MKKQFTFIESMIKVGVIGFGGGNALIPLLEQEVVNEKKLVSKDEYDKSVIAATLTPQTVSKTAVRLAMDFHVHFIVHPPVFGIVYAAQEKDMPSRKSGGHPLSTSPHKERYRRFRYCSSAGSNPANVRR